MLRIVLAFSLKLFIKSIDNIVHELQGLMFGYATDETEECMPLTVVLAHKLNEKVAELRRNGVLWWARPDTKTQVNFKNMCLTLILFLKS